MNKRAVFVLTCVATIIISCNGKGSAIGKTGFCDTICMKDSLKFIDNNSKLKPYVYISAKNCDGDTLTWGYSGQNKNIVFNYRLNKDFTRCIIKDTSFAMLIFNTCNNGRGYFIRFSYAKRGSFTKSATAINNLDPKFSVADSLVAYTDGGNLIVEEINTAKQAVMTFGQVLDFDYDAIHETLDSVNITAGRIWAKAKVNGQWKEFEKTIAFN